jgi:hypothetical protein
MSQRLLAAGTINKSVRIPGPVTEIIRVIIKFEIAIFAFAVESRVILVIAGYRIRIDYS